MSQHRVRDNPKVIALVILSLLFPSNIIKDIIKQSGIKISDRSIRRVREDLRGIGIEKFVQDMHKAFHIITVNSVFEGEELKQQMLNIVKSDSAENADKIMAGKLYWQIIKDIPEFADHGLSESLKEASNILDKNENNSSPLQEEDNSLSRSCRAEDENNTQHNGVDLNSTKEDTKGAN